VGDGALEIGCKTEVPVTAVRSIVSSSPDKSMGAALAIGKGVVPIACTKTGRIGQGVVSALVGEEEGSG
jgi:hypothetical protein